MERKRLPKRDAWAIVAIVHIGIVLLLVTMGGCRDKTRERDDYGTPEAKGVEEIGKAEDYAVVEKEVSIDTGPEVVAETPTVRNVVKADNEVRYVVQPGDSLWKISRTFGVSVDAIADRNDIQDPKLIRAGRELWIPNPTKGLDEAATEPSTGGSETVVTEPVTGEGTTPDETTTPVEPVDLGTIQTFDYEVQPGDTIWKLARTYKTTTQIIMQLNGITDAKTLRAGQTIKIPKEVQETPVEPVEETPGETPEETLEPVIE